MELFIKRGDAAVPSGPFAVGQIEMMIQMGQVDGDDLLSRDQQKWYRCRDVPQFKPLLPASSASFDARPAPAPQTAPQAAPTPAASPADELSQLAGAVSQPRAAGTGYSPYGQPVAQPHGSTHRRPVGRSCSGQGTGGFVCSLLGLLMLLISCFAGPIALFLSIALAIVGLIMSGMALSGMKRNRNNSGKGLAIAGLVIGIVAVAVCFILMLFVAFAVSVFMNAPVA